MTGHNKWPPPMKGDRCPLCGQLEPANCTGCEDDDIWAEINGGGVVTQEQLDEMERRKRKSND